MTTTTITERLQTANLIAWQETEAIRTAGDPHQRQAWVMGTLPESELLDLARAHLFRAFSHLQRYRRLTFRAVPHPKEDGLTRCALNAPAGTVDAMVTWTTTPRPELVGTQWLSLNRIRDAMRDAERHPWHEMDGLAGGSRVFVEVRQHRGVCSQCQGETSQNSALVTIHWAGRVLSREYAL